MGKKFTFFVVMPEIKKPQFKILCSSRTLLKKNKQVIFIILVAEYIK